MGELFLREKINAAKIDGVVAIIVILDSTIHCRNDTIESILKAPEGQVFIGTLLKSIMQSAGGEQTAAQAGVSGEGLMKMLGGFSVKRMLNLMGTAGGGKKYTREELLDLNAQLNKIKRA